MDSKIFLVINLSCFGDVLLTNSLCQNIKLSYPTSKVIYITDKPFVDAAKFQQDVDEVYSFDKRNKNKGFIGLIKFVQNFPYRNKIFASFVIYGNDRGILLSKLLNCKHIISNTNSISKYFITNFSHENGHQNMQNINGEFLEALTHKHSKIVPIKVNVPTAKNKLVERLKEYNHNQLIALSLFSETNNKNMSIKNAIDLINKLNSMHKIPLILGTKFEQVYTKELKQNGCIDFIDLTGVTSIKDLMQVLAVSQALISIDTGTLHLGCALNVPTIAIFYQKHMIQKWGPSSELYNLCLLSENISTDNILDKLGLLLEGNMLCQN